MTERIYKIVICFVASCFYLLAGRKMFGAIQQSGYRLRLFFKWLRKKNNLYRGRLWILSGLTVLSGAVVSLCFSFLGTTLARAVSLIPFVLFSLLFLWCDEKYALKVPLQKTARIKRIGAVYAFFLLCFTYVFLSGLTLLEAVIDKSAYSLFAFVPFGLCPVFTPVVFSLAVGAEKLYSTPHNRRFVKKAENRLKQSNALKIAVVGSYAKTSVKQILSTLLSEKGKTVATPASFNTPVGIAKTVMDENFSSAEIFVAEVGARRIGDVSELCAMIKPDFAVFTGVCAQHIETFGSIENVLKAKSEVFEKTKNKVVCASSLQGKIENQKAVFADENAVKDVELSATETKFTLTLFGDEIKVRVPLLGQSAVENILLCVSLLKEMGWTKDEVEKGLKKLQPVPHRLELIEANGAYILDDAYNTSEQGAKNAVDALKRFSGKKTVITPGIVEGGVLEESLNFSLGTLFVGLDEIILIGDTLVSAVKNGYLSAGGDESKVKTFPTLSLAKEYYSGKIGKGDAVLFLSDLPDVY